MNQLLHWKCKTALEIASPGRMPIGMRVEAALEIVSPGRMPIGMRVEVNWFYIEMAKIKKL